MLSLHSNHTLYITLLGFLKLVGGTENMSLTRSCNVQGAILKVWCMVLLLSCSAKADQYDTTFDPITRRTLTGDGGSGDGTCPSYKVIDVSKYENAKGDGKTDDTPVSIN